MSSPSKKATNTVSQEVTVPLHQQAIQEPWTVGSTTTMDALRVRKPNMNKKKLNKKKKKRVLRIMFFYDSDEGSEERVPDWEDSVAARGYCYDLDKLI